jgi:hypothetical protein
MVARINSNKPFSIIGFSMTGSPAPEANVINARVTFPLIRIAGPVHFHRQDQQNYFDHRSTEIESRRSGNVCKKQRERRVTGHQ